MLNNEIGVSGKHFHFKEAKLSIDIFELVHDSPYRRIFLKLLSV